MGKEVGGGERRERRMGGGGRGREEGGGSSCPKIVIPCLPVGPSAWLKAVSVTC